ncbi:MAG: SpaH/EbpB family LPXTG-anchored major pilin [Ruminococcus sp.]|nr:SpaH/EbpB family LPXTG-anchored major pilin [Ruminococcus sp.]
MKTTKKIFAALLVVMMLVMMIPFSASAATEYSVAINGKKGYTIDVYKIATVDIVSGAYSDYLSDDIKTILGTKASANGVDSEALLAECEATAVSTSLKNVKFDETATTKFTTTTPGIYYIKVTGTPAGTSVKKTGGAVVSIPNYDATSKTWVTPTSALNLKIEDGTVGVHKTIVEGTNRVSSTTANIGDTITFELTASVTGSKEQPLSEYTIHDTMSAGLCDPAVESVYVDNKKLTANTDYTVNATDLSDIKIALTESYLNAAKADNDNGFYSASNVVVTLTAKLDTDAVIAGDGNTNSDGLTYTNTYGQQTVPGDTVRVYTFELNVLKVDATTKEAITDKTAGFTVYTDEDCTTVAANGKEAKTGTDGKVKFTGFKAGTYYVKETTAPAGYSLNSTVFTVNISTTGVVTYDGDNTVSYLTVEDTPIVLPATGGMGTMVFTIVGASLIVCAGVLFIVARRKKASK